MINAAIAAASSASGPPDPAMNHANGSAAAEPQVPGAIGSRPAPNHVDTMNAGCQAGRVVGIFVLKA